MALPFCIKRKRIMTETFQGRLTSKTDRWYTPDFVLMGAHKVLNGIDVDPFCDAQALGHYRLSQVPEPIYTYDGSTPEEDGFTQSWLGDNWFIKKSVFVNPPGGKQGNKSKTAMAWEKLLHETYEQHHVSHALFLSFSMESAQVTQCCTKSILDFPTVFFKKRLAFIDGNTGKPVTGNTHGSCLTYVPGSIDDTQLFYQVFSQHGTVVQPMKF